jgi:hypothetical protein
MRFLSILEPWVEFDKQDFSLPNQEDHGVYPWVNWSSGTGCSPLMGVSWKPRASAVGLHKVQREVK